jgi:hypothetical protein
MGSRVIAEQINLICTLDVDGAEDLAAAPRRVRARNARNSVAAVPDQDPTNGDPECISIHDLTAVRRALLPQTG